MNWAGMTPPGVDILAATWRGSGSEYAWYSGTSQAAPMVSGVVGLLLAIDPSLTPEQVADLLTSTAQDIGQAGKDDLSGHGIVDAGAAVAQVVALVSPTPTNTPTRTPTSTPTATNSPTRTYTATNAPANSGTSTPTAPLADEPTSAPPAPTQTILPTPTVPLLSFPFVTPVPPAGSTLPEKVFLPFK